MTITRMTASPTKSLSKEDIQFVRLLSNVSSWAASSPRTRPSREFKKLIDVHGTGDITRLPDLADIRFTGLHAPAATTAPAVPALVRSASPGCAT